MQTERISRRAFNSLPEYSCTLPTGTTIGKVWKRNRNFGRDLPPDWVICEYLSDPEPGYVRIEWRKPEIVEQ